MIKITKEFRFEGAHALKGYDGKCCHIHGHSYKMEVTVYGDPINDISSPKNGMVIDFGDLKRIIHETIIDKFDHSLILKQDAPLAEQISKEYGNTIITDFQPTSEQLVSYFAKLIIEKLPTNIKLDSIRLWETATSYAEWTNDK